MFVFFNCLKSENYRHNMNEYKNVAKIKRRQIDFDEFGLIEIK